MATKHLSAIAVMIAVAAPAAAQISYPVDFKLAASTASTTQSYSYAQGTAVQSSSSLTGLEVSLGSPDGALGLFGRTQQGTFTGAVGTGKVNLKEGGLYLGARPFAIVGAYSMRQIPGSDSTYTYARAGFRSIAGIGASGLSVNLAASYYIPLNFAKSSSSGGSSSSTKIEGWEGESGVAYTLPMVPLFVQVGYRLQYFAAGPMAQELSGLTLGGGLWLTGR